MKVIVINDEDSHCTVMPLNVHNMVCLIRECQRVDSCEDREAAKKIVRESADPSNSPDINGNNEGPMFDKLLDFILDNCPVDRSGGGRIYIEELTDWKKGFQPFS